MSTLKSSLGLNNSIRVSEKSHLLGLLRCLWTHKLEFPKNSKEYLEWRWNMIYYVWMKMPFPTSNVNHTVCAVVWIAWTVILLVCARLRELLARDKITGRGKKHGQQAVGKGCEKDLWMCFPSFFMWKYAISTSHLFLPGIHKLCLIATNTSKLRFHFSTSIIYISKYFTVQSRHCKKWLLTSVKYVYIHSHVTGNHSGRVCTAGNCSGPWRYFSSSQVQLRQQSSTTAKSSVQTRSH